MDPLSAEELRFHYQRRMSQIEDEMRRCYNLIRDIEKVMEEGMEGHCAQLMKERLVDMEKKQLQMIADMDGMISMLVI